MAGFGQILGILGILGILAPGPIWELLDLRIWTPAGSDLAQKSISSGDLAGGSGPELDLGAQKSLSWLSYGSDLSHMAELVWHMSTYVHIMLICVDPTLDAMFGRYTAVWTCSALPK